MQNLESQLHTLLEDIAPDAHSHEEQAKIIALASATISKKFTARRFAKADGRVLESQMTDAILVAMSTLSTFDSEDDEIEQSSNSIDKSSSEDDSNDDEIEVVATPNRRKGRRAVSTGVISTN